MHVAIVALAAGKGGGSRVRPGLPLPTGVGGWVRGGACAGEVFKPVLASPGGWAGVPGVGLHRCRFVAGRQRGWASPRCRCAAVPACRRMWARGAGPVRGGPLYSAGKMRRGTSNTDRDASIRIREKEYHLGSQSDCFSKRSQLFNKISRVWVNESIHGPNHFLAKNRSDYNGFRRE